MLLERLAGTCVTIAANTRRYAGSVRCRCPDRPLLRAYDWLRGSPTGLFALAVLIGAGAGLGAIAFRWLIVEFTWIFTATSDYSAVGPAANPWVPQFGPWFVVLAAVVGGTDLWADDRAVCPGGAGARGAGGDARGRGARGTDPSARCRHQVACLGGVHWIRRIRGPRRSDRADWVGAGLRARATGAYVGIPVAPHGGVWGGRRHLRDVQRAHRRGVFRARAYPTGL